MTIPAASASMPMPSYAVNEHGGAGNSRGLSLNGHFADIAKTLSASPFNDDLLPKCSDFNMLTDEDATSTNRKAWKSPTYCVFMKSLHQLYDDRRATLFSSGQDECS
jgi:hypothetical protein